MASHSRINSADERRRVPVRRRSTKGPLDAVDDDPLAASAHSLPNASQTPLDGGRPALHEQHASISTIASSHVDAGLKSPAITADLPPKDFSFLQDASAFHVLAASNVPPPFLNAPHIPSVSSPVDTLLLSGHYRLAAIAAARIIVTAAAPTDYDTLFHLLHVRLACLCLISEHALAAQEAKVLGDLNSSFYRHPLSNAHLVPWDLRLLVVRLAALGYGEWRKGIMGYYELARECRESLLKANSEPEGTREETQALWRARLRDCGIRVANVLVEMGDLESAGRHLASLEPASAAAASASSSDMRVMETLTWLRLGDIAAAERCLAAASTSSSPSPSELTTGTLTALLHLATADMPAAITAFQALHTTYPADAMITQNLAVCLLYVGQIAEARALLEDLVGTTEPFHSLVFNLSTVYELCTERNRERKEELAKRVAARKSDGSVGWEMGAGDFKL